MTIFSVETYVAALGSSTPSILIKLLRCQPSMRLARYKSPQQHTSCQGLCYAFHVGSSDAGPCANDLLATLFAFVGSSIAMLMKRF